MNDAKMMARNLVLVALTNKNPTIDLLREHAARFVQIVNEMNIGPEPINLDEFIRELEAEFNIFQPAGSMLIDDSDHIVWLQARQGEIEWKFWDRYLRYKREYEAMPPLVLQRLDESTSNVLSYLEDPSRIGRWSRRGLVAGQVQSGKTGHYTGLICKGIDAGYRVVVVLTGTDNNLRSQTQLRIDEGVIGFDSQHRRLIEPGAGLAQGALGVGLFALQNPLPIASLTNSSNSGDFTVKNLNVGFQPEFQPIVAVVKKNVTVLKNLRRWLETVCVLNDGVIEAYPLLLIDDEADNASVNTGRPEQDPKAINREIRLLLKSFARNAYVGYTATPFANIYIKPDDDHPEFGEDLHPRSFIETIKAPSNYFGPSRLFGVDTENGELPLHRSIDDTEEWMPDKHKADQDVGPLPESLKRAMKSFVLARAARLHRGHTTSHNSMLVHVTRFNKVQKLVRERVDQELELIKARIKFGDGNGISIEDELKEIWDNDFVQTSDAMSEDGYSNIEWELIRPLLRDAVDPIVVRSINGDAKDVLEYFEKRDTGFNVIAIGGNKLSRGLTLEGLTISYYLRASRAFDTLLQMGRWFGYRVGYEDLCRLFTTRTLWNAYRAVTEATNETYRDFDEMSALGRTPRDYGLKVKDSVEGMIITSANKMRHGVQVRIGFAGNLSTSTSMFADKVNAEKNLSSFNELLERLKSDVASVNSDTEFKVQDDSHILWNHVSGGRVVDFFESIRTPNTAYHVNAQLISRFIRGRIANRQLIDWTVMLSNPRSPQVTNKILNIDGFPEVHLSERRMPVKKAPPGGVKTPTDAAWSKLIEDGLYTVKTVVSPADEMVDLTESQRLDMLRPLIEEWEQRGRIGPRPNVPKGTHIRTKRPPERGLLMIYAIPSPIATYRELLLDAESKGLLKVRLTTEPLIGFAISFPHIENAPDEDYVVTQQFIRDLFGSIDDEEDENIDFEQI